MKLEITHNTERQRFEAPVNGQYAHLDYEPVGNDKLEFHHTWTPTEARGRGIARAIVLHALQFAEDEGKEVIPSCPFVRRVMEEEGLR